MFVPNNRIAVTPFPKDIKKRAEVVSGFAGGTSLAELIPLIILYGNDEYKVGYEVYVAPKVRDIYKNEVYIFNDQSVVFLDTAHILLYDDHPDYVILYDESIPPEDSSE